MEAKYLCAVVDFLNREDQTVKSMMCYPITRVALYAEVTEGNLENVARRIFVVNAAGKDWVRETPAAQPSTQDIREELEELAGYKGPADYLDDAPQVAQRALAELDRLEDIVNLYTAECPGCKGRYDPNAEFGPNKGFIVHKSGCVMGWPDADDAGI